jgi:hypothetical protein
VVGHLQTTTYTIDLNLPQGMSIIPGEVLMEKMCINPDCTVAFESNDVLKVYCTSRCAHAKSAKDWYHRKRDGVGPVQVLVRSRITRVNGINGTPVIHPEPIYPSCKMDNTLPEVFLRKVHIDKETGCYVWTASKCRGYGVFPVFGRMVRAHRFAWEFYHGPIAPKLMADHICRNRACVNIEHLRLVTHATNNTENSSSFSAKFKVRTHCKNGHKYTEENSYVSIGRGRVCRACKRMHQMRRTNQKKLSKQVVT